MAGWVRESRSEHCTGSGSSQRQEDGASAPPQVDSRARERPSLPASKLKLEDTEATRPK